MEQLYKKLMTTVAFWLYLSMMFAQTDDGVFQAGNWLAFDGIDDHITMQAAALTSSGEDFTMECWINTSAGDATIYYSGDGSLSGSYLWFGIETGYLAASVSDGDQSMDLQSSVELPLNTTLHIAMTFTFDSEMNTCSAEIFQNGKSCASNTSQTLNMVTITKATIGGGCADKQNFKGNIDEFKIWQAALPENIIASFMKYIPCIAHPFYEQLALWYPFNQSYTMQIEDETGFYNGLFQGGFNPQWTISPIPFEAVPFNQLSYNISATYGTATSSVLPATVEIQAADMSSITALKSVRYGLCYSQLNETPQINDFLVADFISGEEAETEAFQIDISALEQGKPVYVRPFYDYLIDASENVFYGDVTVFQTLPEDPSLLLREVMRSDVQSVYFDVDLMQNCSLQTIWLYYMAPLESSASKIKNYEQSGNTFTYSVDKESFIPGLNYNYWVEMMYINPDGATLKCVSDTLTFSLEASDGSGFDLSFDGSDSSNVAIPNAPSWNHEGSFTIEAWVKPQILQSDAYIMQKGEGEQMQYCLALNQDGKIFGKFGAQYPAEALLSNKSLDTAVWQYIAVVVDYDTATDKSQQKIYLSKYVDETYEVDGITPLNASEILLGENFKEAINELRVWTVALPDSVLKNFYNKSISDTHPYRDQLSAYYTFNEHGSEILWDQSGNQNNGALNGPHAWQLSGSDSLNDDTRAMPDILISTNDSSYKYHINSPDQFWYKASELPASATSVSFCFIDDNNKAVHEPYLASIANNEAVWNANMADYEIPFSAQLRIRMLYCDGGYTHKADYLVPMVIISDTLLANADKGWGPFITDNYDAVQGNSPSQASVYNTFRAGNFPPRTRGVLFTFTDDNAQMVCDTMFRYFSKADFQRAVLNHKSLDYVESTFDMSHLPLNATNFTVVTYTEGSTPTGDTALFPITIDPLAPTLDISNTGSYTVSDKQIAQSLKFYPASLSRSGVTNGAVITNSPGQRTSSAKDGSALMKGPYSFHLLQDNFTFEFLYYIEVQDFAVGTGSIEIPCGQVENVWGAHIKCDYSGSGFTSPAVVFSYGPNLQEEVSLGIDAKSFNVNQHHHIAIQLEDGNLNIFHDGTLIGTKAIDAYQSQFADSLGTQAFHLGGSVIGYEKNMHLMIDECRLWKTARTESEIQENMYQSLQPEPNLVGYWNFDDPLNKGYQVWDKSFTPNHGTISGGFLQKQLLQLNENKQQITAALSLALVDSLKIRFIDSKKKVLKRLSVSKKRNGLYAGDVNIAGISNAVRFILADQYYTVNGMSRKISVQLPFKVLRSAPRLNSKYDFKSIFASSNAKDDVPMIYNPFVLSHFPEKTNSVQLFFKNRATKEVVKNSQLFTENGLPYAHSIWFGDAANDEAVSQGELAIAEQFGVSLWFNTSSTEGGKILGIESSSKELMHTIYVDTTGLLRFYIPTNDGHAYVLTDNAMNDGEWHHLAAGSDGQSLRLYVDGSLVDCKMDRIALPKSGQLHIAGGSLDSLLDCRLDGGSFNGSITNICIYDRAWTYKSVNEQMFLEGDTTDEHLLHYYPCLAKDDPSVLPDAKAALNATISGNSKFRKQEGIKSIGWNTSLMQLPVAVYDLYAHVDFAGFSGSGMTYYIDSYNNKNPLPTGTTSVDFDYSLSDGLGYFDQGMIAHDTLFFSTNWQSQGGGSNYIHMALYDSTNRVLQHQDFYYTSSIDDYWIIQLEGAAPGSYFEICFGNDQSTDWEHCISEQLYVLPMAPPLVTGNWSGPFTQSIVPGVMTDSSYYNIATVADGINRIQLTAYNSSDEEILHCFAHRVDDENWGVSVDMGDLEPPTSYFVFDTYLGNDEVPSFSFNSPDISILDVRPQFIKTALELGVDLEDGYLFDTLQDGNTASFLLSLSLPATGGEEEELSYEIPSIVPLVDGEWVSNTCPVIEKVPFTYLVKEDQLNCDENMSVDLSESAFEAVKPTGSKLLNKYKVKISVETGSKFGINEDNEFWLSNEWSEQLSLSKGGGALIESCCVAFEDGLMTAEEAVKAAFGEISAFIWFDFKFGYSGAEKFTFRTLVQSDLEKNTWGSIGNTDISFENEEAENENSSFWFLSIAPAVDLKAGLEILSGIFELNMVLVCDVPFGVGHSWCNLPEPDHKTMFSANWSIYFKIVTEELFGFYEQTLFGPTQILHGNILGSDYWDLMAIPPIEKAPKTPFTANTAPVRISWFNRQTNYQPRAHFVKNANNTGIVWMDINKQAVQMKSLKYQAINPINGAFMKPVSVSQNRNVMHSATACFMDSSEVFSVNVKNKLKSSDYNPKDLDLTALGVQQQISMSLSNPLTGEIIDSSIFNNVLSNTGLTACGKPQVVAIDNEHVMLVWISANVQTEDGRLLYAIIDTKNEFHVDQIGALAEPANGICFAPKLLQLGDNGQLMAIWQQKQHGEDFQYHLLCAQWNGSEWSNTTSLAESSEENKITSYDVDVNASRVALAWVDNIREPLDEPGRKLASIMYREYSVEQFAWSPAVEIQEVCQGSVGRIKLALSDKEATAILFDHGSLNPNLVSGEKINQLDLMISDESGTWKKFEASPFICDTTKYTSDFDICHYRGDEFIVLCHEHYWTITDPVIYHPLNGVKFGDDALNLVLRGFEYDGIDLYQASLDTLFSSIEELPMEEEQAAEVFELYQNAPNPADSYTNVRMFFNENCQASLDLIDLGGNVLHQIFDRNFSAGLYESSINVNGLPVGVYFIRLTVDGRQQTVKMIKN